MRSTVLIAAALLADPAALAIRGAAGWEEWWRSDRAPARWEAALPAVAGAVAWQPLAPGVEWGELTLSGAGEAWRVRVVLARLDPGRVRLTTQEVRRPDGLSGLARDLAGRRSQASRSGTRRAAVVSVTTPEGPT